MKREIFRENDHTTVSIAKIDSSSVFLNVRIAGRVVCVFVMVGISVFILFIQALVRTEDGHRFCLTYQIPLVFEEVLNLNLSTK